METTHREHTIVFSIVVPVYNVAAYLEECLDSLRQQTYPHIEVIMVDDGSTDSSALITDRYAQTDSRFRVIHQPNAGLSAARNRGMSEATGHYLMLIDSDDYIDIHTCQTLLDEIESAQAHPYDVIMFSRQRFDNQGHTWLDIYPEGEYATGKEFLLRYMHGNFSHSAVNKCYRMDFIREHGLRFVEGILYEDGYFTLTMFNEAGHTRSLATPLYFYRSNPASIMHTARPKDLDVLVTVRMLDAYFAERHDPLRDDWRYHLNIFRWVFSAIAIKYPCRMLFNQDAHRMTRRVFHSPEMMPHNQFVEHDPHIHIVWRLAAWGINHCYPLFALCVYLSYNAKQLIKR